MPSHPVCSLSHHPEQHRCLHNPKAPVWNWQLMHIVFRSVGFSSAYGMCEWPFKEDLRYVNPSLLRLPLPPRWISASRGRGNSQMRHCRWWSLLSCLQTPPCFFSNAPLENNITWHWLSLLLNVSSRHCLFLPSSSCVRTISVCEVDMSGWADTTVSSGCAEKFPSFD